MRKLTIQSHSLRPFVLSVLTVTSLFLSPSFASSANSSCRSVLNKPESFRVTTVRRYIENIEGLLDFPRLSPTISLAELKALNPGTVYHLEGPPNSLLIQHLLKWGHERSEAGLMSFRGRWILILSDQMAVKPPESLIPLLGAGLSSFDLHTHPSDHPISALPSFGDMRSLQRTLDKIMYIASPQGLSVIKFFDHNWNADSAFMDWAKNQGYPTENENFRKRDWQPAFAIFLKKYHAYEVIPWKDEARIQHELNKGQYDPLADSSFVHAPPPDWESRIPVQVGPFTVFP